MSYAGYCSECYDRKATMPDTTRKGRKRKEPEICTPCYFARLREQIGALKTVGAKTDATSETKAAK